MKSMILSAIAALILVLVQHMKEKFIINDSWVFAYIVFLSPSLLLLGSCYLSESVKEYKFFSLLNWVFIALWCLMLITKSAYLAMPISAIILLIFSVFCFIVVGAKRLTKKMRSML